MVFLRIDPILKNLMKYRRKSEKCLNCEAELRSDFEFCPKCGQENTNNYVSVRELFNDLIGNYLSFDSRFGRSILPFLFLPAKLPTAFIEGERMRYLPPVRLYLIVSVVYFFVFNQTFLKIELQSSKLKQAIAMANDTTTKENITEEVLKEIEKDSLEIAKTIAENPALNNIAFISSMANVRNLKRNGLVESEQKDTLSEKNDSLRTEKKIRSKGKISLGNLGSWDMGNFQKWATDPNMSPEALLDSMGLDKRNEMYYKIAEQILKVGRNDMSIFVQNVVGNISLMMLILLPVFAFYLKILYLFAKKLYIGHLILMLYFQSFIYFVGIVDLLLIYALEIEAETVLLFNLVWFFAYIFFMFKGVYEQSYVLTFFKILVFSCFYSLSLLFFLLAEMLFSFLFF